MTNRENETADSSNQMEETGTAQARARRTPWRGWLMAVPLAAAILVAYLVIRTWVFTGPTITVTFPRSGGITAKGTPVKYKGMKVGSVSDIEFIDALSRVKVTLEMHGSVKDALNSGTRFWLVQPSLTSGNIAALLSGPHIGMRPGSGGKTKHHFQGTLKPPALPPAKGQGSVVTLTAAKTNGLGHGASVMYRGLKAGKVLGANYDDKTDSVRIKAFIKQPYDKHLTGRTRFWRTGGIGIARKSSGIDIKTPNITNLLHGGVAFAELQPKPASDSSNSKSGHTYKLYGSHGSARHALAGPNASFSLVPQDSLHGLTEGAPVLFQHIKVGRVIHTRVRYNPEDHGMDGSAVISLYARPFGIAKQGKTATTAARKQLEAVVADLVQHGLRARLTSGGLILGGEQVVLDMTGRSGAKHLDRSSQSPRIPVVASSGSIADAVSKLNQIASKINAIPIQQISRNVQQTSANIRSLSGSPKIRKSLTNLEKSLANVRTVTAQARDNIGPTLQALENAADAADSAAQQINQSMGGRGSQAGLSQMVDELTRTSRSIRTLTSYLQRHPEALLRGRSQ